MSSIAKRRRKDGGTSWDAEVCVRDFHRSKSFRSRHEADAWAARTEAAAYGRTIVLCTHVMLNMLIDEAKPRLRSPLEAALKYWRAQLGPMRVRDISPALIANHRDRLLSAQTRSHGHKRTKPRTPANVRHYLSTLTAVFNIGIRELRWCEADPVRGVRGGSAGLDRKSAVVKW